MARQYLDADRRSPIVGEDRQRRDHGPRLPRPLAGGLRPGALVRHEVAQHGRLLRVQPGCLLRQFRDGDDQAREAWGQDAGHRRRDTPGLPIPELVAS